MSTTLTGVASVVRFEGYEGCPRLRRRTAFADSTRTVGSAGFLTGAWSEFRGRTPGMMMLISLAIIVAFLASAATTLGFFDLEFWWELSALVVVMLLRHWQEMKALGQARGALSALAESLPDEAERVRDGETERVSLDELAIGDVVLRAAGRWTRAPIACSAARDDFIRCDRSPATPCVRDSAVRLGTPPERLSRLFGEGGDIIERFVGAATNVTDSGRSPSEAHCDVAETRCSKAGNRR